MLRFANGYEAKVAEKFREIAYKEQWKYFWPSGVPELTYVLPSDQWNTVSMVSVDFRDEVIGIFSYSVDHRSNYAYGLDVANFSIHPSIEFAADLYRFIRHLFVDRKFNKVKWTCYGGNPAEKSYDRVIKNYGGRIVGISYDDVMLYDGSLMYTKVYEVFRKSFEKSLDNHKKPMVH